MRPGWCVDVFFASFTAWHVFGELITAIFRLAGLFQARGEGKCSWPRHTCMHVFMSETVHSVHPLHRNFHFTLVNTNSMGKRHMFWIAVKASHSVVYKQCVDPTLKASAHIWTVENSADIHSWPPIFEIMAEQQSQEGASYRQMLLKWSIHHYKLPHVDDAEFAKWYTEVQVPQMMKIVQRHGIVKYTLVCYLPRPHQPKLGKKILLTL